MVRRGFSEMAAGAIVLLVAVGFLGFAVVNTGRGSAAGYTLNARFDRIDGLAIGSDVRIGGVKVGAVTATHIDPKTYQAVVAFTVEKALQVPKDSSAQVTSDGLLGGRFLSLVPGGDDTMLPRDGTVSITQSALSLEDLLGKFIFSVSDLSANVQKQLRQNGDPAPK